MTLKVVIEPGEDFGFVVHVPALRGCISQGNTREEAIANIREAIEGWLSAAQESNSILDEGKGETFAIAV